jgi:hypothetical protein
VPIDPYLVEIRLDSETRRVTGIAFEITCAALKLTDSDDGLRSLVARKIIELAKAGETNPDQLCERALIHLRRSASATEK